MLIDFHTHIFPPKVAPKAIDALEHSSQSKAVLDGTLDSLKESMKEAGVDLSVVLPIATRPKQTHSIIDYALETNQKPGFLSFASVHPMDPDYKGQLRRIQELGFKGIKLHPDFQDFFIDDPEAFHVMDYAASLGLIIVLHSGEDISYPDCHHNTPKRMLPVIKALPGAKIVAAHMGGWRYWDDVERLLMDTDLYIDTCFSLGFCSKEQFLRIARNFNPDRILFGTDSPWTSQKQSLEEIRSLGLDEDLMGKILGKNAQALLGL